MVGSNSLFSSGQTSSAPVRLMGFPSAPEWISTYETLDGNINISWAAPSDTGYGDNAGSLLTMYEIDVSLCAAGSCKTSTKRVLSSDDEFASRTALIKADMLPETAVTYTLTIQARNALGWSAAPNAVYQEYK